MRNRNRRFRNEFGRGVGQMFGRGARFYLAPRGRGFNRGDKPGSGPSGSCVCTSCGNVVSHDTGIPCNTMTCPNCGAVMTRK